MCVRTHVYTYEHVPTCACVCVWVRMYSHVFIYVCLGTWCVNCVHTWVHCVHVCGMRVYCVCGLGWVQAGEDGSGREGRDTRPHPTSARGRATGPVRAAAFCPLSLPGSVQGLGGTRAQEGS